MDAVSEIRTDGRAGLRPEVPVYEQLVNRYKADVLERRLQPGQRVDSITEIQRKHGVARETAKRVLKILEREGLIVQRVGKGSFVADLRPKSQTWGLVAPFFSVQYEDLVGRVMRLAAEAGREVRLVYDNNSWEEEIRLVGMMQRERYEAVIVIPTLDESRTWSFYSRLSPLDAPVVLFDHTMTYRDFSFVVQSYDLGVVRALDYLLDQKPAGVAFVRHEGWTGRNLVLELMVETYHMVMRRRRPDFEPVILDRAALVNAEALRDLGVTGIFCCDDVSAIQVIGRLREQGVSVPGSLNLASYGNTDLARFFTPAITSVDPHNEEMALRLVELLTADEQGAPETIRQYVVQPELVVRET